MKEEKTKTEIKDIYILTRIDVGGGCIRFCDIVERCTNPAIIDYEKDIPISKINEINQKNCNSLIYKNNIDGLYPVFVGVDKNNNIRKIIIEANHESLDELVASKEVMHDQFFNKEIKFKNVFNAKRIKLFDFKLKSGFIYLGEGSYDPFERPWHQDCLDQVEDFKKNNFLTFSLEQDLPSFVMAFNKGSYPVYSYSFSARDKSESGESDYVNIVIEDLDGCRLNQSKNNIVLEKVDVKLK